jgi:ABC-2 type transport system permease protein
VSLRAITRKEFRQGLRSRAMWGLTVVAVLLLVGSVLTGSRSPRMSLRPAEGSLYSAATLFTFAFPLAALAASYGSIAGEVDAGRARSVLGLPVSRTTVFAATLLGRVALAWLAVGGALVLTGLGVVLRFGRLPVVAFLTFSGLTLLFVVVWTTIGVGISGALRHRGRALTGALSVYFVLVVYWISGFVSPRTLTARFVEDVLGWDATPVLYEFVFRASPGTAYTWATAQMVTGEQSSHLVLGPSILSLVLCCWAAGFVALGVSGFRNAEIR